MLQQWSLCIKAGCAVQRYVKGSWVRRVFCVWKRPEDDLWGKGGSAFSTQINMQRVNFKATSITSVPPRTNISSLRIQRLNDLNTASSAKLNKTNFDQKRDMIQHVTCFNCGNKCPFSKQCKCSANNTHQWWRRPTRLWKCLCLYINASKWEPGRAEGDCCLTPSQGASKPFNTSRLQNKAYACNLRN